VLPWLASDRPDEAEGQVIDAISGWADTGFLVPHLGELLARTSIDLYRGERSAAWCRVAATWPALVRSRLLRVQHHRLAALATRAWAAIAGAAVEPPLLDEAARCARQIQRERAGWSDGIADAILATVAFARGDVDVARRGLELAAQVLARADLSLHAAVARLRLGMLCPGGEGRLLIAEATGALVAHGIKRPDRFASALMPWPADS
jgi:hypothetical protein